jgi:hypothetical protein
VTRPARAMPVWAWIIVALGFAFAGAVFWILNLPPTHGDDVSADPRHALAIGQRFRTLQPLEVSGVTLDPHYAKRVDTLSIEIPPGFSGREVVQEWRLPAGAELRVVGVRRWGWGPLAHEKYRVERLDAPPFAPVPMTLPLGGSINFGLDPGLFQPLGRTAPASQ